MDHQTSYVPPIAYNSPQSSTQPMTEFPQMDSAVASSRFLSTNNQLRTSSNPRNQATIQDSKEGRQGWLNVIIIKVKVTWLGNALNQRGQGMLHGLRKRQYGQAVQTTIPNNDVFQIEDLDAYDSDCDDVLSAKAVLMANLSSYGSDVLSEEKANQEKNNESVTPELERYKEQVKTFEQRLNVDLSTREKMIDSRMDDMINEKLALK
ncbi:hypothetical protein Tco_0806662 [Tanacetum coccineum]